jgi:hypothetical protein
MMLKFQNPSGSALILSPYQAYENTLARNRQPAQAAYVASVFAFIELHG